MINLAFQFCDFLGRIFNIFYFFPTNLIIFFSILNDSMRILKVKHYRKQVKTDLQVKRFSTKITSMALYQNI